MGTHWIASLITGLLHRSFDVTLDFMERTTDSIHGPRSPHTLSLSRPAECLARRQGE